MASPSAEQIVTWADKKTKPAHSPAYKRLTDTDRVLILQLAKEGKTQTEIAQRIGCHQSSVSDWLAKCRDTTEQASTFLRGSALKMARNIVNKGQARDHIQALKGINVLEEQQSQAVTVIVGGGGTVNLGIALSPSSRPGLRESQQIPE